MESDKKPMWIKVVVIMFLALLLMGLMGSAFAYYEPVINYSDDAFPLVVIPKVNGFIKPDTQFEYQFIFATDENCVDDVYTTTQYLTTDKYGVASTTVDLSGITEIPSYLCEYRDGSLRKVHQLNERLFMKQITEQDIIDYGFIKNFTDTKLNDSDISGLGYIKDYTETDPTITLQKLQNLTLNDFHNLGGTDRVLTKSEIEQLGFLLNETDYCKDGVCDGDLKITGDLILIGTLTNVNASNINTNGSIIPEFGSVFDLGSNANKWNNIYGNNIYGNVDYSQLQNVPSFLLTETDPKISSTYYNQWCRGTGTQIVCDVAPFVDTQITDSGIGGYGYIKFWTETDPIYSSDPASTITATDIFNWATAYSWGNHENEGYIKNPNDAVDSNELDNLCNQNDMVLKRINNTWVCSDDIGFIPTDLLQDYNFSDNSIQWNKVYYDYYNNTNGYLTSYTETDPIFIGSPSYNINTSDISNWNNAFNWGNHNLVGYLTNETDPLFTTSPSFNIQNFNISNWNLAYSWGNHNNAGYITTETDPLFTTSPSSNITNIDISNWDTSYSWGNHNLVGYLTNETDPLYIADKNGIVFFVDTINWDTNVSDDFDGQWSSLNAIPVGFLDGVDNDTIYTNLSEFINDVGYLTSFSETDPLYISDKGNIIFMNDTLLWDKDYTDDFDGNWSSLQAIPSDFLDGVDNDTKYYNLSEFVNDVGYLTSYNEIDPIWNNEKNNYVLINSTDLWDKDYTDDFNGSWYALSYVPSGFSDGVDNDTKYYLLSEFTNDVGYLTSFNETDPLFISSPSNGITYIMIDNWEQVYYDYYNNTNGYLTSFIETDPIWISEKINYVLLNSTSLWDKDYTDDFDYEWSSLLNIPNDIADGDNDTKYYNLSEFFNDVGFITSYIDTTLNESQVDAYVSNNGYLTSYNETDPIWNNEKLNYLLISSTLNWDTNVSDDFDGNYNNLYNTPINLSSFFNDVGYLTSFSETDPLYNLDKSNIVFFSNTTLWDKDYTDDFDYEWSSLLNIPLGFLDGVDNDTKYYNLSEFVNDVGYLTSFNETDPIFTSSVSYGINQTMIDNWNYVFNQINSGGNSSVIFEDDTLLWDKDYTDDFNGSWYALTNIPSGFADGIDDDTTYSDLSEFNNDVGYYKSGDSPNFNDIETNSISVGGQSVCLEDGTNCQEIVNNTQLYNPKYVTIKDEFLGDSVENGELGELGWTIDHYNSATTFYEENDLSDIATHPAVVTCSDDYGWQSGCTYSLGESFVVNSGMSFGYVVQSTQLSGSRKVFGLTDYLNNPVSDIDDGVYMVMSEASSTIIGYVERSDSISSCDTGVTINDYSWYQLEMRVNENTDGIDYYVNDVYRCSVNAQLPSNPIGPKALGHYTGSETNTDIFKIDLFYMTYELPNNRWD